LVLPKQEGRCMLSVRLSVRHRPGRVAAARDGELDLVDADFFASPSPAEVR
jgi:hypothetical protein